jgi:hypothetical protein
VLTRWLAGSRDHLARPVGFDVAHEVVGGASDSAGAVVAVDGQLRLGHIDGDGLAGVDPAKGDLLSDDHDDAAVGGPALDCDRSGGWLRRWPGRAGGTQPPDLGGSQWVGPGAQQFPGFEVEEHQGLLVDPDADAAAGEDFGGEDQVLFLKSVLDKPGR